MEQQKKLMNEKELFLISQVKKGQHSSYVLPDQREKLEEPVIKPEDEQKIQKEDYLEVLICWTSVFITLNVFIANIVDLLALHSDMFLLIRGEYTPTPNFNCTKTESVHYTYCWICMF